MPYAVQVAPAARRNLKRLRGSARRRIAEAIDRLADNPRPRGATKLEDSDDLYRVRVGDYRIIYKIEDDRLVVLVVRIGHRRDIYKPG